MRNVIVTGGSRGLGLAITSTLAEAGYSVIVLARSQSAELSALGTSGQGRPGAIHFRAFDLADTAAIGPLVGSLRSDFGTLYGLVNNAGIGTASLLSMMRDEQIDAMVRLNTVSPIILTKYVVRSMMVERAGRIINMASISASTGYSGLSAYAATKASLVGFTRSLAREVGQLGITVNAVAPGFVDTEMTRKLEDDQRERIIRRSALRRLAGADDVAKAVEYLLSDSARNVTGTTLTVDAGNTA
jgi:3-oxoacyl-[acyl-carrier protein] reductase